MMNLKELRSLASDVGLPGRSTMNKAELVEALAQWVANGPATVEAQKRKRKRTARKQRARIQKRGY
jgi:CelD/BcsL family acetyltransferase involved in cellulose biosynthesis